MLSGIVMEIWPFEVFLGWLFQERRSVGRRWVLNITLTSYTPLRYVRERSARGVKIFDRCQLHFNAQQPVMLRAFKLSSMRLCVYVCMCMSVCHSVTLCSPMKKVQARITMSFLLWAAFMAEYCDVEWGDFPRIKTSKGYPMCGSIGEI